MPQQYKQSVNIVPPNVSSGRVEAAESMAETIGAGRQLIVQLGEKAAIKRGQKKAEAVKFKRNKKGITIAPEFAKETLVGQIEAEAHNQSLKAAYLASLDSDIRSNVDRIALENPDNIIRFNEQINSFRQGLLDAVDPVAQQHAQANVDVAIGFARNRVYQNEIKKQQATVDAVLSKEINETSMAAFRQARNGDLDESAENIAKSFLAVDALVDAGLMDADVAAERKRGIERIASEQNKMRFIDALNIKEANKTLNEWSKSIPKGWTPDEWRSFIGQAQVDVNRREAQLKQKAVKLSKEELFEASVQRGKLFLDPAFPADPSKSSQDRKDVNNYYSVVSQEWADLTPMERYQENLNFVTKSGIIPDTVVSDINAVFRSGTPDQINAFSHFIQDIREEPKNANILKDIPEESRALAMQISDAVNVNIPIEEAIEIARKNTYGLSESDKERIKLESNAMRPTMMKSLNKMLGDEFDPEFWGDPTIAAPMLSDFNVAFDRFMVQTGGNGDQARRLAFDSIKGLWGVTRVAGKKRFMKYAPEVLYGINGVDNGWIPDQFESDMKTLRLNPKNVEITVDFKGARSGQPGYILFRKRKDGPSEPIFDKDGNRMAWTPDFKETKEYFKMKNAPVVVTEKAQQARDALREINDILGYDVRLVPTE